MLRDDAWCPACNGDTPHSSCTLTGGNRNAVLPRALLHFCRDEPSWHISYLTLQAVCQHPRLHYHISTEFSHKQKELNPTLFSATWACRSVHTTGATHLTETSFCMLRALFLPHTIHAITKKDATAPINCYENKENTGNYRLFHFKRKHHLELVKYTEQSSRTMVVLRECTGCWRYAERANTHLIHSQLLWYTGIWELHYLTLFIQRVKMRSLCHCSMYFAACLKERIK